MPFFLIGLRIKKRVVEVAEANTYKRGCPPSVPDRPRGPGESPPVLEAALIGRADQRPNN